MTKGLVSAFGFHPDLSTVSPLKIRGGRPARRTNSLAGGGVMRIAEITLFLCPALRGKMLPKK